MRGAAPRTHEALPAPHQTTKTRSPWRKTSPNFLPKGFRAGLRVRRSSRPSADHLRWVRCLRGASTTGVRRPDPLATYKAKRDFASTPEPAGETPTADPEIRPASSSRSTGPGRCTGICASNARASSSPGRCRRASRPIPKTNHLAVHTEDHPLEYLDFAGEIPVGEYGAGSMHGLGYGHLRDATSSSPTKCRSRFHGERVRGRYVLFRPRARLDDPPHGSARRSRPRGRARRAATDGRHARRPRHRAGEGWAWELKWDGIRALGYVDGGRIRLFTRNGNEVTPPLSGVAPRSASSSARAMRCSTVRSSRSTTMAARASSCLQRRMHVDEHERDPAARRRKCPSCTCCSTCCGSTAIR